MQKKILDSRAERSKLIETVFHAVLLCLLVFIASRINGYLFTAPVLKDLFHDAALIGILAMSESLVMACGGIDFSVANSGLLCASMAYYFVATGATNPSIAIGLGILSAVLVGFINGVFITWTKLSPVFVTLATSVFIRGISGAFTNNIALFDTRIEFESLSNSMFDVIPVSFLLMIILMIVCTFVFHFTTSSRLIFAVGESEQSARISGLRVSRIKILTYGTAGLLAGLGGLMILGNGVQAARFYDQGAELEVLFAVLLGGVTLRSGTSIFFRACIGGLTMAIINLIIYKLSIYNYSRAIYVGLLALIIAAVAGEVFRSK